MRGGRSTAAWVILCHAAIMAAPLAAQSWNAPSARELAERAVARRTMQLTDSTLAGYRSRATGYLTFLAQVGDTALLPPKVIKQDQIAVEIIWAPPASSKQIVVGLRDTTLLPSDIGYYRDRYGIVQSNFPDRIRMGDGKDIADVLHPFAPAGLDAYDFAVTDSLSITSAQGRIDVHRLAFRPREPSAPRAAGSAYLDVRTGDIVRLELTFTRAAILDRRIEHLAVVLENALIEGRYWLPHAQQIEVQRAATWLQIEVRGIIRGRWEVCCYEVDMRFPVSAFYGPSIAFVSPDSLRSYKFEGNILDALPPGTAAARSEDVERATAMASELIARAMRERSQRAALTIPAVSEIVRVNRAEGIAVGASAKVRVVGPMWLDGRGRYGVGDARWKGELGVSVLGDGGRSVRFFGRDDLTDVRDVHETSGVRNSLAAGLFGSDYTDPVGVRSAGVDVTLGRLAGVRWRIRGALESHRPLDLTGEPATGRYEPLLPARSAQGLTGALVADGAQWSVGGGRLSGGATLRAFDLGGVGVRTAVHGEYAREFGAGSLFARTIAVAVSGGDVAPQEGVYLGGPTTAPGYRFTDFAGRRGVSQRVEWHAAIPFVPITLGRYGTLPGRAMVVPFVNAVWIDGAADVRSGRQGWYPSVGIGLAPFLEMARFDVARGLRDGRWTFSFDVMRGWWGIL
jgi:hypothetical protein